MLKRGIEKKKVSNLILLAIFSISFILVISLVSAGVGDLFNKITGRATSGPTDVTVTISGIDPVDFIVHNSTLIDAVVDPTENSTTTIPVVVTVIDPNGATDINDSSVKIAFFKDAVTRSNSTACVKLIGQANVTAQNYSCSIGLWYFDVQGDWTINVTATDYGNLTYISNADYTFSYDQLQAMVINPATVTWSSVTPGNTNQTSVEDTTINNTGNYDLTGKIQINATNLYSGSNFLDVGNITSDIETGGSPPVECVGTQLVASENTAITGVVLAPGNLSEGGGTAQEVLYYCLTDIPLTLPSGTYDTTTSGAWTIRLF